MALSVPVIVLTCVFSTLVMAAGVGNGLLCYVTLCSRHQRHESDFFIASLAFADVLMCAVLYPISFLSLVREDSWNPPGEIFCKLWSFVDMALCAVSIYTMAAISINVSFHVRMSFTALHTLVQKHLKTYMAGIWQLGLFISAVLVLLSMAQPHETKETCLYHEPFPVVLLQFLLVFLIPFVWCVGVYIQVLKRMLAYSVVRASLAFKPPPLDNKPGHGLFTVTNPRHGVLALGMKLFVFFLVWTPFFLVKLTTSLCRECTGSTAQAVVPWLPFVSSWISPFIYGLLNKRVHRRLRRLCGRREARKRPPRSAVALGETLCSMEWDVPGRDSTPSLMTLCSKPQASSTPPGTEGLTRTSRSPRSVAHESRGDHQLADIDIDTGGSASDSPGSANCARRLPSSRVSGALTDASQDSPYAGESAARLANETRGCHSLHSGTETGNWPNSPRETDSPLSGAGTDSSRNYPHAGQSAAPQAAETGGPNSPLSGAETDSSESSQPAGNSPSYQFSSQTSETRTISPPLSGTAAETSQVSPNETGESHRASSAAPSDATTRPPTPPAAFTVPRTVRVLKTGSLSRRSSEPLSTVAPPLFGQDGERAYCQTSRVSRVSRSGQLMKEAVSGVTGDGGGVSASGSTSPTWKPVPTRRSTLTQARLRPTPADAAQALNADVAAPHPAPRRSVIRPAHAPRSRVQGAAAPESETEESSLSLPAVSSKRVRRRPPKVKRGLHRKYGKFKATTRKTSLKRSLAGPHSDGSSKGGGRSREDTTAESEIHTPSLTWRPDSATTPNTVVATSSRLSEGEESAYKDAYTCGSDCCVHAGLNGQTSQTSNSSGNSRLTYTVDSEGSDPEMPSGSNSTGMYVEVGSQLGSPLGNFFSNNDAQRRGHCQVLAGSGDNTAAGGAQSEGGTEYFTTDTSVGGSSENLGRNSNVLMTGGRNVPLQKNAYSERCEVVKRRGPFRGLPGQDNAKTKSPPISNDDKSPEREHPENFREHFEEHYHYHDFLEDLFYHDSSELWITETLTPIPNVRTAELSPPFQPEQNALRGISKNLEVFGAKQLQDSSRNTSCKYMQTRLRSSHTSLRAESLSDPQSDSSGFFSTPTGMLASLLAGDKESQTVSSESSQSGLGRPQQTAAAQNDGRTPRVNSQRNTVSFAVATPGRRHDWKAKERETEHSSGGAPETAPSAGDGKQRDRTKIKRSSKLPVPVPIRLSVKAENQNESLKDASVSRESARTKHNGSTDFCTRYQSKTSHQVSPTSASPEKVCGEKQSSDQDFKGASLERKYSAVLREIKHRFKTERPQTDESVTNSLTEASTLDITHIQPHTIPVRSPRRDASTQQRRVSVETERANNFWFWIMSRDTPFKTKTAATTPGPETDGSSQPLKEPHRRGTNGTRATTRASESGGEFGQGTELHRPEKPARTGIPGRNRVPRRSPEKCPWQGDPDGKKPQRPGREKPSPADQQPVPTFRTLARQDSDARAFPSPSPAASLAPLGRREERYVKDAPKKAEEKSAALSGIRRTRKEGRALPRVSAGACRKRSTAIGVLAELNKGREC